MCVCFGGGEVWAHAQCLKAKIWHFENVTTIPETKKQEENGESVMNRLCMLWEVWDLETIEGGIAFSEWETGRNESNASKTETCTFF